MEAQHGAGFRVTGMVEKVFPAASGKFCRVTIGCPDARQRMQKIDVVAFSDSFECLAKLGVGEEVQVTGNVAMEKITDRQKNPVKVDGYDKWSPMLVAKASKVLQSQAAPPESGEPAGW